MTEITLRLNDLASPDCAQKIGQILEKQKGVQRVTVSFTASKVKFQYDPEQLAGGF